MTEQCVRCLNKVASKIVVWDERKNEPFCSMSCFLAYPFEEMTIKKLKGGKKQ